MYYITVDINVLMSRYHTIYILNKLCQSDFKCLTWLKYTNNLKGTMYIISKPVKI